MNISGLVESFVTKATAVPDRIFATHPDGALTFGALLGATDAMAARFAEAGAKRGDCVVVMMRNGPAALAVIFGLMRAGLVWVPVNTALQGEGLAHILRVTTPRVAVCDADYKALLLDADSALPCIEMTGSLLPKHPANPPVITTPIPGPQDLCAIMFTSGTTGPAKGVMVTHLMLELSARAVAHLSETRDGDVFFMWEPFFHIGGAQVIVMPFLFPITLALQDRFSASRFWDQVRDCGATQIHHLGGIIQILLKQPRNAHDKDHKVRICWGGGCAPSAWRPFEDRFGVRIRECYGMTEASSITTYNDRGVVGSVGAAVPWFNVTLQNPEGRALGPDEGRGEIVVITNLPGAIFGGYYRNPEATAKALRPDGFYTGDVGSWDADGLMYFHGRMSDSVRCRGENVSAHEVESVAGRHSDVEDCAMVGVPAEIGEQDILLFIQPAAGTNPDPAAISAWLERQLPPYQRPRFIAFVESFERTPSQRIKKHLLPMDSAIRWDREHQSEP